MNTADLAFICLSAGAFSLFGAVLAWASFKERSAAHAKTASSESSRDNQESYGSMKLRAF